MCSAHFDSPRIELTSQLNTLAARIENTQRLLDQVSISASILSSETNTHLAIVSDLVRLQLKCLTKYKESEKLKIKNLGSFCEELVDRMGRVYYEKLSLILGEEAPSQDSFIEKWKEKTIEHLIIPKVQSKEEIDEYIGVLRKKLASLPRKEKFHVALLSKEAAVQEKCKQLEERKARLLEDIQVKNVFEAAQAGDLPYLEKEKPNPKIRKEKKIKEFANQKDERQFALLHIAAYAGRLEVVRFLIENKADIEVEDEFGNRPLHWAAAIGATEVARALLDQGADFDAHGVYGRTPLHRSVFNSHEDVTQLLLDYGADKERSTEDGAPPIREAIGANDYNMVRLMLREGATVEEKDLEIANSGRHPGIIRLLRKQLGKKQEGVDQLRLLSSDEVLEGEGEILGRGASAVVRKGFWNGRPVAVKLDNAHEDPTSEVGKYLQEQMEAEALLMSELDHPNVLHFVGMLSDRLGFVVDYIANGELYEAIPTAVKHGWDWNQILSFGEKMAQGLAYLHSKKIIHRDLKSPNVLIDEQNQPVIVDFGISKVRNFALTLTQKAGSPFWMAPEQFVTSSYSYPVDVYAFGMILWEILSCKRPFEQFSFGWQVMEKITKEQPGETINHSITPSALASLLKRCWLDADSRPSADEVVDFFRQLNNKDLEGFIRPFPIEDVPDSEIEILEDERLRRTTNPLGSD